MTQVKNKIVSIFNDIKLFFKEAFTKKYWQTKGKDGFKNLLVNHNYIISLILLLVLGRIASDNFLSINSLKILLRSSIFVGVIALGMTFVIISGNIDLSVGSTLGLVGIYTAIVFNATLSITLTFLFAIAFGAVLGLINGIFIGRFKVAAFIVTLATMAAYRSLTVQQGSGGPVILNQGVFYDTLYKVYFSEFLGIPISIWIFAACVILMIVIANKTKFGRYVYAIGSNEKAARLAGINVERMKVLIFTLTGVLVGVAAFLYNAKLGAIDSATAGKGYELDVIAAVAIGGTSMAGGKGYIQGTLFGVISLFAIDSVLAAYQVPAFVNDLIKGILILGAVLLQIALNRNKKDN